MLGSSVSRWSWNRVIRRNVHRGIGSVAGSIIIIMILIMEICKAHTLRLKALNKYNTHIVHRDGSVISNKNVYKKRKKEKKLTHNVERVQA